jgi:hypothetical protein
MILGTRSLFTRSIKLNKFTLALLAVKISINKIRNCTINRTKFSSLRGNDSRSHHQGLLRLLVEINKIATTRSMINVYYFFLFGNNYD